MACLSWTLWECWTFLKSGGWTEGSGGREGDWLVDDNNNNIMQKKAHGGEAQE